MVETTIPILLFFEEYNTISAFCLFVFFVSWLILLIEMFLTPKEVSQLRLDFIYNSGNAFLT